MENMLFNGIRFSIEFIKTLLAVVYIFDVQVKKKINSIFGISLMGVMIVSYWINLSEYGIFYWTIIFIIFLIALHKKRNVGFVILSYTVISIFDMLFGIIGINIFPITMEQMQENYYVSIILNSISMFFLIIGAIIIKKNKKRPIQQGIRIYLPIIILSGVLLSVYLTYTLLIGLEDYNDAYYNGLVISAIIITIMYFVIGFVLLKNQMKNHYLRLENDMNQRLLKSQNDYYSLMLKKENETKMFRHDIKGHLMCIQMLYEQKKYEELGEYLKEMDASIKELSPRIATGNAYIDMILVDLMEQFPGVELKWTGKMPELSISSMDICTLFYNLMKNAFEAAEQIAEKNVKVITKIQGTNLLIEVSNSYRELNQNDNAEYLTTKKEKGHGYGLKNIEKCINKYKGSYTISTENEVFCTEIILPNVIKEI